MKSKAEKSLITRKRSEKFLEYMKSFFKEEDRLPSLTELSTRFGTSYTAAYRTMRYLEKTKVVECRESDITNRRHYRFAR